MPIVNHFSTPYTAPNVFHGPVDVFHSLCDSLAMDDLQHAMATSTATRVQVQDYLAHDFKALLHRFELDPSVFRGMMRIAGAVIGGISALEYLMRDSRSTKVLDVYVPHGEHRAFRAYLKGNGYSVCKPDARDEAWWGSADHGVLGLMSFWRKKEGVPTPEINIWVTSQRQVMKPLACALSTAHMAYLSADSIHTPYPQLTFARRAIVPLGGSINATVEDGTIPIERLGRAVMAKVKPLLLRGFDVATNWKWGGPCGSACGVEVSRFGGEGNFKLVFDAEGAKSCKHREGFSGYDTRFYLRGRCFNVSCPNYGQDLA